MEEKNELDLKGLIKDIVKRAWIVVLCAAVLAATTLVYTVNFVEPTYKASVTMYVNNNAESNGNVSSSNLAVALQLAKTYVNIIKSDLVLDKVIEKAALTSVTTEDIRQMLSAEVVDETEIFEVVVTSPDPEEAESIASAIAYILPKRISSIIEGTSAKVVDAAVLPTRPTFSPG